MESDETVTNTHKQTHAQTYLHKHTHTGDDYAKIGPVYPRQQSDFCYGLLNKNSDN